MFNGYKSSGKHMICDIRGIENEVVLNNTRELNKMLQHICDEYSFTVLSTTYHNFEPQGCSILFLLSESHISIHTFPEKNHLSFDIYTCRQYDTNREYNEIYNFIIEYLNASENSTFQIIDRYF